jgi:NADH dehydrogenase
MKHVVIVGGGFAGINAAKSLGNKKDIKVTLIDKRNHHLFQPLLYQVAMAGLSPAEIATPIRSILSGYKNIKVLQAELKNIRPEENIIETDFSEIKYDDLILACGANHSYFGNNQWEKDAPGLKNIEQATEIRRRVLSAFEAAERLDEPEKQKFHLTFVIVGGGPTGVELAGAIGEMSRFTLAKDFKNANPKLTRIILVEASNSILNDFSKKLRDRAIRDLEKLGVQVWTSSRVTKIDDKSVMIGEEKIETATVLWAAGIKAFDIGKKLGFETDGLGRIVVEKDLSVKGHKNIYVAGDLACFDQENMGHLPPLAPVAMQQGRFIPKNIIRDLNGEERLEFSYFDKGKMATIGRSKAIVELGKMKLTGFFAWVIWLVIHIYYLSGFKNKFFVFLNWTWSYLSFKKGARLILSKEWKTNSKE